MLTIPMNDYDAMIDDMSGYSQRLNQVMAEEPVIVDVPMPDDFLGESEALDKEEEILRRTEPKTILDVYRFAYTRYYLGETEQCFALNILSEVFGEHFDPDIPRVSFRRMNVGVAWKILHVLLCRRLEFIAKPADETEKEEQDEVKQADGDGLDDASGVCSESAEGGVER